MLPTFIPHMKKTPLVLAFFLLLFKTGTSQQSNLVRWDESRKIAWDHFYVKDGNDRFAAECHTFFKASFYLENDSVFCQVVTYLNKDSSWRKPSLEKNDAYTINHEQMHFDITEIFARRIRKELLENTVNEQELKQIYFDHARACRMFQQDYDRETRHSIDRKKQTEWNVKIRHLLHDLRDYKEQAIFIENPWCKLCWKDMPKADQATK